MFAVVWLLMTGAIAPSQQPLTVSAAVSLTEALTEIADVYQKAAGGPVRFNFAASNVLARQIVYGAPVDLFISADEAQMDVVQRAGRIDPSTRTVILTNLLAVMVRAGNATTVRDAADLGAASIRRIAIGNPDGVPAGAYARAWLRAAGVWDAIESKIVPVGSVRAALAAVENRSVDAAIVYQSDAALARSASVALVVTSGAPKIAYPAAVVSRTAQRDAAMQFLAFLRDDQARRIFREHKFPDFDR